MEMKIQKSQIVELLRWVKNLQIRSLKKALTTVIKQTMAIITLIM